METVWAPFSEEAVEKAAALLRAGEVVAFPTETVYGLGGNGLDPTAVQRIFAAKERPNDNPLILHIADIAEAEPLCHVSDAARTLAEAFWPGPLTILLPKKPIVPDTTTAGLSSVALRLPRHPAALALIRAAKCPIAAPSANRSGKPSPTTARHVYHDMQGRIPMILDGGECEVGVESTVLDMTGEVPTILRPGRITAEQVAMVLGECRVADSVMRPLKENESAPSPGMRHRHYAPQGRMTLVKGDPDKVAAYIRNAYDAEQKACILAFEEHIVSYPDRVVKSMGQDAEDAAHRLFYLLRELDECGCPRIFAETLPETGLGLAVMNRMARAAAFDIVTLP